MSAAGFTVAHRFDRSLRISLPARQMARQLAAPDGMVVFVDHPLANARQGWSVTDDRQGGALFEIDAWRQLLAYGVGEIAPIEPPLVDIGGPYRWQIRLTDRGRDWLKAGAPLDIQPPASLPSRRGRAIMRRMA